MKNKTIYYALIGTFTFLYLIVAFVSTLHAITFFQLANTLGLAILLGIGFEVGQATVLFSILLTDHKERFLPWFMMFLLTGLQVSGNVFASYKYMINSGSTDWQLWQKSILFGVQAESPEMYQVIISWIIGALLPIIALGMTALVADNIHLLKDKKEIKEEIDKETEEEIKKENEEYLNLKEDSLDNKHSSDDAIIEYVDDNIKKENKYSPDHFYANLSLDENGYHNLDKEELLDHNPDDEFKKPINKMRGWHLMDHYIDDEGNVFKKGKFQYKDMKETPTSKQKKKRVIPNVPKEERTQLNEGLPEKKKKIEKPKVKKKELNKKKIKTENDKIIKVKNVEVNDMSVIDVKK